MPVTPDQFRAARALLALDQSEVARRAHVSIATLRRVEGSSEKPRASMRAIKSIQHALEAAGAEFIDNGVRRRSRRSPEEIEARVRRIMEIAHESAKLLEQYPGGFTEEDLYDENGLPA
jgi:transcriptional regulator with XRE-family HTH domain